jgi:hypothetical protein
LPLETIRDSSLLYLNREKARGPPPAAPDPDKQEDDEAEVKKKRAWDDWTDDHKRGSGNTYRHG